MAFTEAQKAAFECIKAGVEDKNLCLVECTDDRTGEDVVALCGAIEMGEGRTMFIPVAKMFDGNPFEQITPKFSEESEEDAA